MKKTVPLNMIYVPSENIVARQIQGEFIIVPITSGIGDLEDDLFTLNKTGKAIWEKLDGKKTLLQVAESLSTEYHTPLSTIKKDISGFTRELLKRKILVAIRKKYK